MLDGIELQAVQQIEGVEHEAVRQHEVPALEGDFLQDLGREAVRISLDGVISGDGVGDRLKALREKFAAAKAVPFVADIATATRVDRVLVEELGIREIAGKPARFEYAMRLREFVAPPPPNVIPIPPPIKPPPVVVTASLTVEVIVVGQPGFDFSTVTVRADGTRLVAKTTLGQTLVKRVKNIFTEDPFDAGSYTVTATAKAQPSQPAMTGTAKADIAEGEKKRVTIILTPAKAIASGFVIHFWFDKAFVEPCLRDVLLAIADHAAKNPNEKMLIVGHTDLVGDATYNQSLSERRARSVFAFFTFATDRAGAIAEWNRLRKRAVGEPPSIDDTWGVREYQYMLQDLGLYTGNVDEVHGQATDTAVRAFQGTAGLPATGFVDDATWSALIAAYLARVPIPAIPQAQFFKNADGISCDSGILKWVGCGEQSPVKNTEDAFRPNRRTEVIFVSGAAKLPCPIAKPVTFDLPAPGAVGASWCLGAGANIDTRCCFIKRGNGASADAFPLVPAEPGPVIVRGSLKRADGTPIGQAKIVVLASDGEFLGGEIPQGARRGRPTPTRTKDDGSFAFSQSKTTGTFIFSVLGPFVIRLASAAPGSGKGDTVCTRLDGSQSFDIVADP